MRPLRYKRYGFPLLLLALVASAVALFPRLREWQLQKASLGELSAMAAREPGRADVRFYLGLRELAAGNPAAAAASLQRAVELAPGRPEYRMELARALRAGGADAAAFEQLQRVTKQAPENAEAQFVSGMLLLEHGRTQEAEAPLLRATELNPKDADAWYALGRCLGEIRQEPRAEAAYRRALAINSRFVGALLGLGNLLAKSGRDAEAVTLLARAGELAPQDLDVWRALGATRSRMARSPEEAREAENLLRSVTSRAPNNADAHYALGMHHLRQGRRDDAALEFRAAVALNPRDTGLLFALGRALGLAGKQEEAARVLAQFEKRNDYQRQARYLSMRIGRMPDNPDLYAALGDLHAANGARDRALFEYQRALRHRPADPAIRRKIAALQRAGRSDGDS
jgi:Flp pilus assembly protein TadD